MSPEISTEASWLVQPTIFISRSFRDLVLPAQQRFLSDLRGDGRVRIWDSAEGLRAGEPIMKVLDRAIMSADYVFFLVPSSKDLMSESLSTELMLIEANQVVAQKAKLVPIFLNDGVIPDSIRRSSVVDLRKSYRSGYKTLLDWVIAGAQEPLGEFELDEHVGHQPILTVSSQVSKGLIEHFVAHPEEMRTLHHRKFEELVAELFEKFGYEVELTKRTRDGGRDIIAVKSAEVDVRYLIECKRWKRTVGIEPVRALYGVKTDEKATKAILATTAHFSKDAKLFFENHKWEMEPRDYDGVLDWLKAYKRLSQDS